MSAVSAKEAAIVRVKAIVMDLLRIEARSQLAEDAERGVVERDMQGFSAEWYGVTVNREEYRRLTNERTAAELVLKRTKQRLLVVQIRGESEDELVAEIRDLEAKLSDLDGALWALEQETLTRIQLAQEQHVEQRAMELYDRYMLLSERAPFSPHHPAVPQFLRRWIVRQRERGALDLVPEYRLLVYLVTRDTVYTGIQNGAPVDDDLPVDNLLEQAGQPANRIEARMDAILERQFMHENGDRRIDRDTQLGQLHVARIAAEQQGQRFTERYDFEAPSEYHGLPNLKALLNPDAKICRECGSQILDNIVVPAQNEDGQRGWQGVTQCDCTTEVHTRWCAEYDEAAVALLERFGEPEKITRYRVRQALRRAAAHG